MTAERLVAYHPVEHPVSYSVRAGDRLYFKIGEIGFGEGQIGIIDISDPLSPVKVAAPGLEYFPKMGFEQMCVYDEFVIVTGGPQIFVYDTVNSTGEFEGEYDHLDTWSSDTRCVVHGDHFIRIVNSDMEELIVKVYDMADLISGQELNPVSILTMAGWEVDQAAAAAVNGDSLFIATAGDFHIIDLADIAAPEEIGRCPVSGLSPTGNHLQVVDDLVYILPGEGFSPEWGDANAEDVVVVDISDQLVPRVVARVDDVGAPCAISGSYLLTGSGESIDVYYLTDLWEPEFVRTLNVRLKASAIHLAGDFAIVPEVRPNRGNGVGTVLIAPYR